MVGDPETVADLAQLLRQLRRREARKEGASPLTYRELAAKTGWSRGIIGEYFAGRVLPPTDRFDVLIRLLGASPAEQGWLASARDRVEERRRAGGQSGAISRQLPPAMPGFAGRTAELAALDRLLTGTPGAGAQQPEPTTALITAVSGTAGVGKTALAVYWAHRVADRFPDGQLYLNLRGFDPAGPPVPPADAVRALLDALGLPPQRIPASLDGQFALYRGLLAERRMLVVLDNARDADQVRPLLAGGPACRVLVTSRNQLTGLVTADGAKPVLLGLLSVDEARQLLAARIGADRVAAEPAAVDAIVDICARLPLALAIVAARAAVYPAFSLTALAAELTEARGSLAAFAGEDPATDARAVFSWSYRALGEQPARLFRLLALHPPPDIAAPAMASLAGLAAGPTRSAVHELTGANLLMEHAPGRYAYHDLLRAYADELTRTTDSEGDRAAARDRLLDHYLHTAHAADLRLDPHRDPIPLPPAGGCVTPEEFKDHATALAWFDTELPVLLGMLAVAESAGADLHLCRLTRTMAHFMERRGHWLPWIAAQERALAAALRLDDPVEEAHARRSLGRACLHLNRLGEASGHFGTALTRFRTAGDHAGQARIRLDLGWMASRQDRHGDALRHSEQALELFTRAGRRSGQGRALTNTGWSLIGLGRLTEAVEQVRQALDLLERLGDRFGAADSWDCLAQAHHELGEYPAAALAYRRAYQLWQELGHRYPQADVLTRLGDMQRAAGDPDAARDSWRRALDILGELTHPDAERVVARLAELDQQGGRRSSR